MEEPNFLIGIDDTQAVERTKLFRTFLWSSWLAGWLAGWEQQENEIE
jgi:hypothetical protein